jgi:hypothetical protein
MFKDLAFSQWTLLIVIDDYVPNRFLSCHVFHPRKATSPALGAFPVPVSLPEISRIALLLGTIYSERQRGVLSAFGKNRLWKTR